MFFFWGGGVYEEGERIQIALMAGGRWPNIECWFGSFVIFQGIWTGIVKKHYIFVIFQGERWCPDPCLPLSGSVHETCCQLAKWCVFINSLDNYRDISALLLGLS